MDIISYSKASRADKKAENVQTQLDQAIADGDQLAETQQARVDEDGVAHTTLKERIDLSVTELKQKDDELTSQLAQTEQQLEKKVGNGVLAEMGDLSQEIKEGMTGGSVAVVGEG